MLKRIGQKTVPAYTSAAEILRSVVYDEVQILASLLGLSGRDYNLMVDGRAAYLTAEKWTAEVAALRPDKASRELEITVLSMSVCGDERTLMQLSNSFIVAAEALKYQVREYEAVPVEGLVKLG